MTEMLALLGALSAARGALDQATLENALATAGVGPAVLHAAFRERLIAHDGPQLVLTPSGVTRLLDLHAQVEAALHPVEECPSIPWLTTVQTHWIDAVSLNYAVDPAALASILPPPLTPEIWKGSAWLQVLASSLRDMRPSGITSLFGVCFYQVSYRAAVRYRSSDGNWRRGGCFVRSETNHPVMRAVGNTLAEFKFHDFGAAEMVMVRSGERLHVGVDAARPQGKMVAILDTRPLEAPPPGSSWSSLDELHEPLVECYDAFGVEGDHVYILTIDRDPWNARFVTPVEVYCEWLEAGPLASGARFDSALHLRECAYRWKPLKREKFL